MHAVQYLISRETKTPIYVQLPKIRHLNFSPHHLILSSDDDYRVA